jgi:thiol-disulfide isomerase/thioredoxin
MADGKLRRVAVIVNGSSEPADLKSVEQAVALFRSRGYELSIVSPDNPSPSSMDRSSQATSTDVGGLLDNLARTLNGRDEVVFYVTGQGRSDPKDCFVLGDKCLSKDASLFQRLRVMPYAKRTVILNFPGSANWTTLFANSPRTLFIASSERTGPQSRSFNARLLLSDLQVPDNNRNATISWYERFINACVRSPVSSAIFLPGTDYADTGVAGTKAEYGRFAAMAYKVSNIRDYRKLMGQLGPADVAVVYFSSPFCKPCKRYTPAFERYAQQMGGHTLFIEIPNGEQPEWATLGVRYFPTVFLFDHEARRAEVKNLDDPLSERWLLTGVQWKDKAFCLTRILWNRLAALSVDRSLWDDEDFVRRAIRSDIRFLHFASDRLRKSPSFMIGALDADPMAHQYAFPALWEDRRFALSMIERDVRFMRLVSSVFKKDPRFMLEAMKIDILAIEDADASLKGNSTFMLEAIRQHGSWVLRHVDNSLRGNPDFMNAVRHIDPAVRKLGGNRDQPLRK